MGSGPFERPQSLTRRLRGAKIVALDVIQTLKWSKQLISLDFLRSDPTFICSSELAGGLGWFWLKKRKQPFSME